MSWNSRWQTGPRGRRAPRSWPRCRACARCARRSIARRSPWPRSIARSRRCSGSWSDGAPSSRSSPPTTPRWKTSSCRSPAGSCAMRDHPLVQLTLARMREFYREPEAIFWVFGFPIVLAFALGIAFRNRGPGELRVAVLRGAGDSVVAAALARAPGLTAAVLDSAEARLQLRTGRVALLVVPGDPVVYRYDSTRTESRLARLEADEVVQRARGRADPARVADQRVTEPGSRYIDFLIPGLLGMNLMGSGLWGVGFSVVQARESDAPQPAPHEIHAEQAGNEEVDVARARLSDPLVRDARRVGAAARALHDFVGFESGQPALGTGRVVPVHHRIARHDEQRDATRAQLQPRLGRVEHRRREPGRAGQRGRQHAVPGSAEHRHAQLPGPAVPKRDAERERQDDREPVHPADRLGLAIELPHAREGQLHERMVTHRAAAGR